MSNNLLTIFFLVRNPVCIEYSIKVEILNILLVWINKILRVANALN